MKTFFLIVLFKISRKAELIFYYTVSTCPGVKSPVQIDARASAKNNYTPPFDTNMGGTCLLARLLPCLILYKTGEPKSGAILRNYLLRGPKHALYGVKGGDSENTGAGWMVTLLNNLSCTIATIKGGRNNAR